MASKGFIHALRGKYWVEHAEHNWHPQKQTFGTVKILKIRTPEKFAAITLKFEQGSFIIE